MNAELSTLPDVTRTDVTGVLVNHWYVGNPERQRAAAHSIVTGWQRTRWADPIVSLNCFVSSDGENVLTYVQSARDDVPPGSGDVRGASGRCGAEPAPVTGEVEWADPVRYRLHRSVVVDGSAGPCRCVVIATFDVDGPERQRLIVDTMAESLGAATSPQLSGLISAHFHRSADGTRVLNYAEWVDERSHHDFMEGFARSQAVRASRTVPGARPIGHKRYSLYGNRSVG